MTLDRKIYLINSFSEADSEQQTNDKNNEKQGESDEMKENQNEPKEKIQSKHSKKIIFTQDLRDSKASQSFAVEQISEHTNRLASRKLMFSQKTSGVIVTPTAEEIYEKGKCVAVNDYFFLKTLGKGAFGEVKLATKDLIEDDFSEDHQRFAIKVLKKLPTNQPSSGQLKFRNSQKLNSDISNEPSDPATVGLPEAIRREIEVMKLLAHKNLVRLLEIISDTQCDSFYMVLEHIEGGPIMIYNHTTNRFVHSMTGSVMGESTARRAFRNLVSGLAHMHSHHIAHRDIKPDNLLVDFNGNLKLSDFGHFSSDRHKKSISLKELKKSTSRGIITKTEGTFPFYSPEMCSESARSYSAYMADTWAASVCLWIFVFGELPFYHHDVTVLFQQIREANPNPVHRVSPELQHLLSVALSKNISLRPYLNEIRYHCWVTEEPLSDYLEKGIVYQSEGQEIPRPGSSCNSGHPLVRKASSYNENSGVDLQGVYDSPFSIKLTKQLKKLADRARTICESRRNEFILNAKSEMNYLVRKRLAEIEALNNCEKLLEQDDEDEDDPFNERNDSDSETSDPLGMMASNVFDDSDNNSKDKTVDSSTSSGFGPAHDRKSTSKQRASVKTAKFSKLNVLASIEDDINRSQSQTDIVVKYHPKFFCCCSIF